LYRIEWNFILGVIKFKYDPLFLSTAS